MKYSLFFAYLATVPIANWMIGNVGICVPNQPCVIPVGFGLYAPSGVLLIGLALVLRDAVQHSAGAIWAFMAIMAGAALSLAVSTPALAIASGAAFLVSESMDMAVYTPLHKHHLKTALFASGIVGAAIDSAAFLMIAFGSLDFLAGQVVGKAYAVLIGSAVIIATRKTAPGELN